MMKEGAAPVPRTAPFLCAVPVQEVSQFSGKHPAAGVKPLLGVHVFLKTFPPENRPDSLWDTTLQHEKVIVFSW